MLFLLQGMEIYDNNCLFIQFITVNYNCGCHFEKKGYDFDRGKRNKEVFTYTALN